MQFYNITILIFGLSEQDGLILDQCAAVRFDEFKTFLSSEYRNNTNKVNKYSLFHYNMNIIIRTKQPFQSKSQFWTFAIK